MNHEFKVVISGPEDAAGTGDPLSAVAARTPDASLKALAASARETLAVAEAARKPMAGLVNVPDAVLAKLETGFGLDSQAKPIGGVERIGQVFTDAAPRPPESSGANAGFADQPSIITRPSMDDTRTGFPPHDGHRAAAPTARASLGSALAGLGTLPRGGQAEATRPGVGKAAVEGHGFEEPTHPADRPHTAPVFVPGAEPATRPSPPATAPAGFTSEDGVSQGFQALDERLARVEQTTREHTSQISNRS